MTDDYFVQSVEHCAAFLAEAIPAVRADMQTQNGPDDPEGFIETGFALSTAVRDREDLADIAALANTAPGRSDGGLMKDLDTETRLDVIYRTVLSAQSAEPLTLARLVERNLREYDMYHAMKLWQREF